MRRPIARFHPRMLPLPRRRFAQLPLEALGELTGVRLPSEEERKAFLHLKPRAQIEGWASAGASSLEQRWITEGVRLPWLRHAPHRFHQGPSCTRASDAQREFLRAELQRGLLTGALEPATSDQYVTRVFLVPKGDKWRIVFDLRHLNSFLRRLPCRYETLRRLRTLALRGDWMISLDLSAGPGRRRPPHCRARSGAAAAACAAAAVAAGRWTSA